MTDVPAAPDDPVLEACIQRALAPYRGRLTPAALAEARGWLTVILTTHPVLSPLLEQVRHGDFPETSGVAVKEGAPSTSRRRGAG